MIYDLLLRVLPLRVAAVATAVIYFLALLILALTPDKASTTFRYIQM